MDTTIKAIIETVFLFGIALGVSWIGTCGIIKLITICFGLKFKWSIATRIWLIICLARGIFSVTIKKD